MSRLPQVRDATLRSRVSRHVTRPQPVVGVGEVEAGGGDVVELLARTRRRLGDVDNLQDLGTAEAGDLQGTHDAEVMACPVPAVTGWALLQGRWQGCREGGGC